MDKEKKYEDALMDIAWKTSIRRRVANPLPIKEFVDQHDLPSWELLALIEKIGDVALAALEEDK